MESLKSASGILDMAIVGGGPAGTAAALEARRRGLRVAIWERERFPRDKVCGEFISSEVVPLLQTEIPSTVSSGATIRCAEFVYDNGSTRAFRLPHPALGLSRWSLDEALWRATEAAGIDAHEGECIRSVRKLISSGQQASAWEIESTTGNIRRAKRLLIAAGRWWAIEELCSPTEEVGSAKMGEWVGAKAHFAGVLPRGNVEMYFFRGGYCGLAPVENGAYNVCCLIHRERVRECAAHGLKDFAAWLSQLARHPALEARLRGATQVSSVVTTAPVRLARGKPSQDGALMVGDASGFLDPFTGEGISMAIHSGRLAAQAVAMSLSEGFGEERAAEIYQAGLTQAVRRSYKIAALARTFISGPAWARGLVTASLPWLGRRLVCDTRWRESREERLD